MQNTFDITPLSNQLTLRQVLGELRRASTPFKIGFVTLLLVAFVPLVIFIIFASQVTTDLGGLLVIVMIAAGGCYGLLDMYRELNEVAVARYFVSVNQLRFEKDVSDMELPGAPFRVGVYVPYAMRSNIMELGHLRPVHGQRRSNRSETQTYMRLRLPNPLPHIVLRRRGKQSAFPYDLGDSVKLKLEGKFGDMFDLYAPKGYERDALYIFTPDVMERFIDATPDFDCEIIGQEMYFYSAKKVMFIYPQNFLKFVAIFNHIVEKFARQSGKYRDEHDVAISITGTRSDHMRFLSASIFYTIVSLVSLLVVLAAAMHLMKQ